MTDLEAEAHWELMDMTSWMGGSCHGCVLRHGCTCPTSTMPPTARTAARRANPAVLRWHLAHLRNHLEARLRRIFDLRCQGRGINWPSAAKFEGAEWSLGGHRPSGHERLKFEGLKVGLGREAPTRGPAHRCGLTTETGDCAGRWMTMKNVSVRGRSSSVRPRAAFRRRNAWRPSAAALLAAAVTCALEVRMERCHTEPRPTAASMGGMMSAGRLATLDSVRPQRVVAPVLTLLQGQMKTEKSTNYKCKGDAIEFVTQLAWTVACQVPARGRMRP
jgi:hypothetical protein